MYAEQRSTQSEQIQNDPRRIVRRRLAESAADCAQRSAVRCDEYLGHLGLRLQTCQRLRGAVGEQLCSSERRHSENRGEYENDWDSFDHRRLPVSMPDGSRLGLIAPATPQGD